MIYSVGLASLVIFFFIILLVASKLLFQRRMKEKYSFRNMFPFEFNYKVYFKDNLYTHIFLALFTMSCIGFFATFQTKYVDGFLIFAMIAGIICSVLVLLLFYIPLVNLRLHIIVVAIFFTLNFADVAAVLISAWRANQIYVSWASVTTIVLSIIIALMDFALIINPKLSLDFKPIEVVKENGEKEYLRPKGIVLAFTEWMLIFLFIFNIVNIAISTFII